MSEPSKVSGMTQQVSGAVKENVGWAMGNKQMEAEGRATREKGHLEVEAARAEQRAKGTGEQVKGNIKEAGGKVLGNERMEAEGKAERMKGDVRKDTNL